MIFVTVGTHEQPFDRLIKTIDGLKGNASIKEDVIIQTGYSEYVPENCEYNKFYTYQQMLEYVQNAHIVITHGGPSSFMMPLQIGKIPIVVPRKKEFNEHVNDHQVEFCREVAERQGNIILVEDTADLFMTIKNYDDIIVNINSDIVCNNTEFCASLEKMVDSLFSQS